MDNSDIRYRARTLFKKNYRFILGVMALIALMQFARGIGSLLENNSFVSQIPSYLLATLTAPIEWAGLSVVMLALWNEADPKFNSLFSHLRTFRRVFRCWGVSVICTLVMTSPIVFALVAPLFLSALGNAGIWIVLAFTIFVSVWFTLKLSLAYFVLADNPERTALECIQTSWVLMKGNCLRLIRLELSVLWPLFVILAALTLPSILRNSAETSVLSSTLLNSFALALLTTVYMGYANLCRAGFAAPMLHPQANLLPGAADGGEGEA